MNEAIVPPLRSRVASTAGPWHLVGRFDTGGGGDLEPGMVSGPAEIDGVDSWLARFDERLANMAADQGRGPAAVRQLTLGGRVLAPAPATPAFIACPIADEDWHQPFLLAAVAAATEHTVSEGWVEINGVAVPVSTFDTPVEFAERINRSGLGVTARHDRLTGRLVLTSATSGPGATLGLGPDTSGVLVTLGLDPATVQPGRPAGFDRTLTELFPGAPLAAAPMVVDGRPIPIDPAADELADVFERISAHGDAVIRLDPASRRVVLTIALPMHPFEIDDASGLLDAVGLHAGVYGAAGSRPGASPHLVVRSWVGAGDRVAARALAPQERYGSRFGLPDPMPIRSASRVLADRVAASPTGAVRPKGTVAEQISMARLLLEQR